jgi:soluble lytic murein transglycosylase
MKIKVHFLLFTLFLFLNTAIEAKKFSYQEIHHMPKSIEKDYYIWRFLSQKFTTKSEALKIIYEASHLNKKLRTSYTKRTGRKAPHITSKRTPTPEHIWKGRSKGKKYFKKGLFLLENGQSKLASSYFDAAYKHYVQRYEKDKSLFWLYMSTKNMTYLNHLKRSHNANIYTLLAADALKTNYPKTITQQFRKQTSSYFDITNPIDWAKVKSKMNHVDTDDLHDLANDYASQECIGIYTYLKAKACNYTKTYFPMPYRNIMKQFSAQRQALIYAIARQESRFVPASVSRSFALGMMQFMPFLVKDTAKKLGYGNMDLDAIFHPSRAIEFADYHLDYLNTYLFHPLFVAYAYNAGIGFTKRYLRNKKHFRKGPYEPYMSMEMMKNNEAREYGKKVLSNYVIYLNKLGVSTRITPLIMQLATPSKTDKFRR